MSEILQSRDCIVLFKGDSYPVTVSQAMVAGGWPGGQGVQWVDSTTDERVVTYSKGLYGGFLVWGSDEVGDRYTSMTQQQTVYRTATFLAGGSLILTATYERYTYASRLAGPPYVPIVYNPNDPLYFSLRGYWTNEDELTLSLDPLRPAFFTGFCALVPQASNSFYMGIQTSL